MHIPALQQDIIVRALGWTFIHSIWQGLLLAILAGLVVLLTRNARAGLRYNGLLALSGLFLLAAGITFAWQLRQPAAVAASPQPPALTAGTQYPVNNLLLPVSDEHAQVASPGLADRFTGYFNEHASMVVLIWFVVFSARLVKLLANLVYVQRIRHQKTYAPPGYWKERVQALADGLRIRRPVQLLQSGIVQVPLVVGTLKPLILMPLGILAQLPPGQVEAILLHELAHIRRRDYLVNLLQSVAEAVFFFNPAVWWVSSLIRDERENCCDDIAVAGTSSKTAFLDALVSFQEYNNGLSKYSMAFPGRKNHLLNRVKRILHEQNKTLNTMEKSLLTFSIAVILLLTLTTTRQAQAQTEKKDTVAQDATPPPPPPLPVPEALAPPPPGLAPAAAPKPKTVVSSVQPHEPETLAVHAQPAAAPRVEARPQPAMTDVPAAPATPATAIPVPQAPPIAKNAPRVSVSLAPVPRAAGVLLIDTLPGKSGFTNLSTMINDDGKTRNELINATDADGKTYQVKRVNNVITGLSVNGEEIPKDKYPDYQPLIDRLDRARETNQEKARQKHIRTQDIKLKSEALRLQSMQTLEQKKLVLRQVEEEKKIALQKKSLDKEIHNLDKEIHKKELIISRKNAYTAKKPVINEYDLYLRKGTVSKHYKPEPLFWTRPATKKVPYVLRLSKGTASDDAEMERQKELAHELIDELVKDGIIRNANKLESFGLNDTELIVNGKKQPDDIQGKYRSRFITHPGFGLFYGPVQMSGRGYFLGKDDF